jgi:hypothetical protein
MTDILLRDALFLTLAIAPPVRPKKACPLSEVYPKAGDNAVNLLVTVVNLA